MNGIISKKFLLDEELDTVVGGSVDPNHGTDQAKPNEAALGHANDNAAFNRGGGDETIGTDPGTTTITIGPTDPV